MLKAAADPRIVIIGAGFSGIGLGIVTPKAARADAFYDNLQAQLGETVFTDHRPAWNKNGEGGRVHSIWPGPTRDSLKLLATPALDEFEPS